MIKITKGNILQADTEAIVNTVNTVGVMGKGIALQFKESFSQNYLLYRDAAERNQIVIGKMFVTETNQLSNPKYVINFPTKVHWKEKSEYEYIETGLNDLVQIIKQKNIKSIAIPPLGCGNGGLRWEKVKELLLEKFAVLTKVEVVLYGPTKDVVYADTLKTSPALTGARALVLELISHYAVLGYEVTLLEIQKLAYFLQRFGEPLRLAYKGDTYGPYAYNLTYLLKYLEGSFLRSKKKIMDSKPFDKIELKKERSPEVTSFIQNNCTKKQRERLDEVSQLIQGFESPFGMELLATVDWVMHNTVQDTYDFERIADGVRSWNNRKLTLMKPQYIKAAYDRLITFEKSLYVN